MESDDVHIEIQPTSYGWCMKAIDKPCLKPAQYALRIRGSKLLGDMDIITTCREHLSYYTIRWGEDLDDKLANDPFWGL